jgi:apolipoprotein N-acyltransferase
MALYPALVCAVASRLQAWRAPIGFFVLPALWVLGELLRGWVYSGFPWLSLGIIALDQPAERFAPVIGEHGLSGLYVLCAYALFRMAGASRRLWIGCVALAFTPLLGMALPAGGQWTHDEGAALPVAIVQGNVPQDQKWQRGMSGQILERYHAMTLAALDAKLVAWPEVVPNQPYDLVPDYFATLDTEARERNATLLAGVLIREENDAIYNSMLAVGRSSGRYDKRHLVPFGEYFPIPSWLRPIMDVLSLPYSDFSSGGDRFPPIKVEGHRIGVSICFEDVFGAEFVRESRDAAFLVNATNDAWFARSSEPHQHLNTARMRALETGRWLVRATNTGLSAFIGPDGHVVSHAGLFTTEILRGEVIPRAGLTPYARWTNAPLWAGSLFIIALAAFLARRRSSK